MATKWAIHKYNEKQTLELRSKEGVWEMIAIVKRKHCVYERQKKLKKLLVVFNPSNGERFQFHYK